MTQEYARGVIFIRKSSAAKYLLMITDRTQITDRTFSFEHV